VWVLDGSVFASGSAPLKPQNKKCQTRQNHGKYQTKKTENSKKTKNDARREIQAYFKNETRISRRISDGHFTQS
jgi:hypothetical protein